MEYATQNGWERLGKADEVSGKLRNFWDHVRVERLNHLKEVGATVGEKLVSLQRCRMTGDYHTQTRLAKSARPY
jgi:hypothetical protein